MVNHTIHTCEQRVRFPLSAIVILFTILPLFSILHHTYTNLPISIHQTQTKNHITISLYNITVSILHSLLQKPKLYLHLLYHTHYYFLPNIYIYYLTYYSSIICILYYYIYTNLQSKYTTILDIYLTYTIITYLLTLKNRTHLSIHLFHPTILFIHTLTYIQYILYIPLLLHHYYFIIL